MSSTVSFVDALKGRYGGGEEGGADALGGAFVNDKKWQFVGVAKAHAKQRQYDRLSLVVLRECGITVAFHPAPAADAGETNAENELQEANMLRLRELDLSANTALSLTEVGKLLPYLPQLTTLQLCDMPELLTISPAISSGPLLASSQITKLVLNNTGFFCLAQLRALIDVPNLTELHLDANALTTLRITGDNEGAPRGSGSTVTKMVFPKVTTLSLAHNRLSDWRGMGQAIQQAFPALTELYLTGNQLTDLTLSEAVIATAAAGLPTSSQEESEMAPYAYLRPLTLLCLKDNANLANPSTVNAIRVLCPHLVTFRITYGSLLPTWNETNSRMYVVAALPTITLLNRGTVRAKERLDSELLYVQRGLQQRERETADQEGSQEQRIPYPLVDVLREKHKDVVLSILRDGDTASMTAGGNGRLLNVTLQFSNGYAAAGAVPAVSARASAAGSPFSQSQQLPSSLTVAKLKALVQKVFQVKPVNQKLSYRSGDYGVLETQMPLRNEQESLGYYGVPDGAIIYVEDTSLRS